MQATAVRKFLLRPTVNFSQFSDSFTQSDQYAAHPEEDVSKVRERLLTGRRQTDRLYSRVFAQPVPTTQTPQIGVEEAYMKTFVLLGALGLANVCYGQTGNKPQISPGAQAGKATPASNVIEAPCGMTPEARATIESLVRQPGNFSLDDPAVDNVFKNLRAYFKLAATCRAKVDDTPAQLRGADDAAMLYSFEDLYDGNRYGRELSLNKTLLDQTHQQSNALADLIQRYNALLAAPPPLGPLFQQPTPIEMECIGTKCDGEILSPRPLPIVPFHMTCRVIVGKVQCDGDLTP